MERLQHVVRAQQFDRGLLSHIFEGAREMESIVEVGGSDVLRRRLMVTLFYEPSMRTRMSFESAMRRLGGEVITTENAQEFSSAAKGETLEDTIRIVDGYTDVIVLRHSEGGAAERAATVSSVPVINAGDGPGQHPTQALLDMYTIQKEIGRLDEISVAMVGDLANGRTVRSLCYLLTRYNGVTIYLVAPDVVRMREDIKEHLREHASHGISFSEETDLAMVVKKVDVVYMTQIQKEQFGDRTEDYERVRGQYIIDRQILAAMRDGAIIMHPLPRVNEIVPEVDKDPRAAYFRQARNGLFVRMALLKMLLADEQ